jgi:hypothetical protein
MSAIEMTGLSTDVLTWAEIIYSGDEVIDTVGQLWDVAVKRKGGKGLVDEKVGRQNS